MKGRYVLGVGALLLLGGCSSNQIDDNHPGIMKIDDVANPIATSNIEGIPQWFLSLPEDTPEQIYAVGTGVSDDMQFSFDKALHSAKVTLGDKMVSKSSAEIKSYISDN